MYQKLSPESGGPSLFSLFQLKYLEIQNLCDKAKTAILLTLISKFDILYGRLFMQISSQKKKTGVIAPKRFVQRVKKQNELFRGYMHQVFTELVLDLSAIKSF